MTFNPHVDLGGLAVLNAMDANVWRNLIRVLRYIGGDNVDIHNNFVTDPPHAGEVYIGLAPIVSNPNATLSNFMENSISRITEIGNGNLFDGLREIREFVNRQYYACATVVRHIADLDLQDPIARGALINTNLAGAGDLDTNGVYLIANFLGNQTMALPLIDLRVLGVDPNNVAGYTIDDLWADLNSIFFPNSNDNAALAFPRGVNAATIRNNVETKASFEVCPHVAFKVGYSFEELGASLYVKFGAMQLKGRVTPVNDVFGMGDEKFNKVTPFVAVGVTRNLDERWGVSVEVSHAFRTTKRLPDVKIFRHTIENRTSISRTNVKIMVVYRI
jgi:hypothetical protein